MADSFLTTEVSKTIPRPSPSIAAPFSTNSDR